MCKSQPTDDKLSLIGVVRSCDPLQNFWGSNHITGTAETKVVKFCTRICYINSSNRMTYHRQKGTWLCLVTVLKFRRLSWCRAVRGLVSDSWATCQLYTCLDISILTISCELYYNDVTVTSKQQICYQKNHAKKQNSLIFCGQEDLLQMPFTLTCIQCMVTSVLLD